MQSRYILVNKSFSKNIKQDQKDIWLKKTLVSSFLQTIWMSASADIANFQMSTPTLRGCSFKLGCSLNFSAVKKGAH